MTGNIRVGLQMAKRLDNKSGWPTSAQQVARRGPAEYQCQFSQQHPARHAVRQDDNLGRHLVR